MRRESEKRPLNWERRIKQMEQAEKSKERGTMPPPTIRFEDRRRKKRQVDKSKLRKEYVGKFLSAAHEVKAPGDYDDLLLLPTVFCAGAIDQGHAEDWQSEFIAKLSDVDCLVLNPRRLDWDSSWKQSKDDPQFREQVEWELDGMEDADLVVVGLPAGSKAPISLMELGIHAKEGKVLVWCPEGYWRKGNVDIVCEKYGIPEVGTFDELVEMSMSELRQIGESKMAQAILDVAKELTDGL